MLSSTEFDIRTEAARRFNRLIRGHGWNAGDMGLFEVHVRGGFEDARPVHIWMPVNGIDALRSVGLSLRIARSKIQFVKRLSVEDEEHSILAAATFDQCVKSTLP